MGNAQAIQVEAIPTDSIIWNGVEFVELVVDGYHIQVPVGNIERKNELYLIKRAMQGDGAAREMLLGDKPDHWFFVGIQRPLWLKITKDNFTLIDPNDGEAHDEAA